MKKGFRIGPSDNVATLLDDTSEGEDVDVIGAPLINPIDCRVPIAACAKSGELKIQGVLRVSEQPSGPGRWILDSVPDQHFTQFGYTNPNDTEGIMDLQTKPESLGQANIS
jgi:hypothetical protein